LVMAVLIAALVSTIDSALNALSTVFTMDVYVKKYKPKATGIQGVKIGRWVTAIGAMIAGFITLAIDSIKGLNLFDIFQSILGFIAPPMAVVFLFGVLWKKTTTKAANFILLFGTCLSLGIGVLYLWVFPAADYSFWPHFLMLSFYLFVLLSLLTVVISLLDKSKDVFVSTLDYGQLPKLTPKTKVLWIILFLVMIGLYLVFNNH